jgi:hypothetical protein
MFVISIDIGYYNLGIVKAIIKDGKPEVLEAKKVDLTVFSHNTVPFCNCTLVHSREPADLVAHFVQEYQQDLYGASTIYIERQPPGGLQNIEALLMYIFRSKIVLVSPNAMHKYFGISHLDYEGRKEKTIQLASEYLKNNSYYQSLSRQHDIADAVCLLLYALSKVKKVREKKEPIINLEQFRLTK